jgi:putative ABC transport system permease protein
MISPTPPKFATRFLRWYCSTSLLEEIEGDALELYLRRIKLSGKLSADIYFIWNVIRFFRWRNIRKRKPSSLNPNPPLAMLKSYFISGVRNIIRNIVLSTINIVGLSVALSVAITIFIILDSYYHRDTFHEKGSRLFLMMNKMKIGDDVEDWARTPFLLGSSIKESHPAVEEIVRVQRDQISVRHDDVAFQESVWFVDDGFFNAFSYKIYQGPENALNNRSNILITREIATKYFGHTDVVGKELLIKFPNGEKLSFNVGAVLEPVPDNSSMFYNILLPMKVWEDHVSRAPISWRTWAGSTFVTLKEKHKPEELSDVVNKFSQIQNEANDKFQIKAVEFIPIDQVAERSFKIHNSLSWSNIPASMIAMGIVASLLVLLACLNYMNVAIASVSTRLKEIGIRKVIGGSKKEIVQQFLIENVLLCAIALIVGTILSATLLLPGFNTLVPIHIPFSFSSNRVMGSFFAGTLLLVALMSGGYPAFYVSSFNAVKILKGKQKFGSKSTFSKVMLTFQFILSFTTIIAAVVFVNSSTYWENKDWGYNHSQNIFVRLNSYDKYLALKNAVLQDKNVISCSGTESHFGETIHNTTVTSLENQYNVKRFEVGFDYLQTMDVHLIEGRMFNRNIAGDKTESAIVNEAFVKKMGWKNPLNETFEFDSIKWNVIGVIEDFYYQEFFVTVDPAFIHIGDESNFQYLAVKADAKHVAEVFESVKRSWHSISPDDPFDGFFQDKVFEQFFSSNRSNDRIVYFIATVAFLLACIGLYGLVSYNLTRRLKEFSVRKVFGASVSQIFQLMNRDYLWIVIISFVIGAPLGFYLMTLMLQAAYPEFIPISAWPFIATISAILLTVFGTVSIQLRRVTRENPSHILRIE